MKGARGQHWRSVVAFGAGARAFALGSQFIVLLILSHIMPKGDFGDMMIAFAFYRLASLGIGTGIGTLVLYHVGRSGGDIALDVRLHRSATLMAFAAAGAVALVAAGFAPQIASAFDKAGLEAWLIHMAPLIVFSTLNTASMGSLDGRSKVTSSIMMNEVIPNGVRLLALPLIPLLDFSPIAAAHVIWISVALPWIWEARTLFARDVRGLEPLSWWDARYVGLYALNSVAAQQLQGIDMLVAGLLFTSEQAGGYAIASRIATLYPFFQQILLRNFTPLAGRLLKLGDLATLNQELSRIRRWSVITLAGVVSFILFSSSFVGQMFGGFQGLSPLLIALAAPAVFRAAFAGIDPVLKMSGKAWAGFVVSAASGLIVAIVPFATYEMLGIVSIPLGMLVSAFLINPVIAAWIEREGISIVAPFHCAATLVAFIGMFIGFKQSSELVGSTVAGASVLMVGVAFALMGARKPRVPVRFNI